MRLKTLTIESFKGIKKFILNADGNNISILGVNGAGKTTVADSIAWLLYDQNSMGGSLQPKPLNMTGEVAHGICSDVEGIFILNDNNHEIILKKSHYEKWTKKRGTSKPIFSGNVTNYYVDDVPVKKKEYNDRICNITTMPTMKLLSNVRHFSDELHWQDRRQILLDICGDISDIDIIASNKELSRIPEILDGKSFDDQKKIIKAQETILNKEIDGLPIRIDEVDKGLPDMTDVEIDIKEIEQEQISLSKKFATANEKKIRIESGGEIAEKTKELRIIEAELLKIENQETVIKFRKEAKQEKEKLALNTAAEAEESNRKKLHSVIKTNVEKNEISEKELIHLRAEWNRVNNTIFDKSDTTCPTCGQEYPAEKAQKIRETFNINKSERLSNINKAGKTLASEIADRKKDNELFWTDIVSYDKSIAAANKYCKGKDINTSDNPQQIRLKDEVKRIELFLEGLRSGSKDALEKVQKEIDDITGKIAAVNLQKQEIDNYKKGLARIDELSDQQKVCAAEFEKLEEKLFIMEEFIRAKVSLLENKVNDKFKLAKFKLFDVQVNGGLSECCEVTYQGVPWNAGLNTGARINVGIDIINTLSNFYGLTLPVFVDNSESIIDIIESDSQIIKLVVDGNCKQLTVE